MAGKTNSASGNSRGCAGPQAGCPAWGGGRRGMPPLAPLCPEQPDLKLWERPRRQAPALLQQAPGPEGLWLHVWSTQSLLRSLRSRRSADPLALGLEHRFLHSRRAATDVALPVSPSLWQGGGGGTWRVPGSQDPAAGTQTTLPGAPALLEAVGHSPLLVGSQALASPPSPRWASAPWGAEEWRAGLQSRRGAPVPPARAGLGLGGSGLPPQPASPGPI